MTYGFTVDDGGLRRLADHADRIGEDAASTGLRTVSAAEHGVAPVDATHVATVERWSAGLEVAAAAVGELAVEIRRCADAYRAGDDAAGVRFSGLGA